MMVLELIKNKSLNFDALEGRKHILVFLGCLILSAPVWAEGFIIFKSPDLTTNSELVTLPLIPAPLRDEPSKPLWFHDNVISIWSYPTEIALVSSPLQTRRNLWVTIALEKYQTRLLSPSDYPYILPKQPISLYDAPSTLKF